MRGERGFSLVEVLCAILILGVGIVGLTVGLTTALTGSKDSEVQTTAALIAAGRIEQLRAEGYVLDGEMDGECGEEFPRYAWKESIVETTVEGLYEVKVTVEHGGTSVYTLQTLLFDPPVSSDLLDDPELKKRTPRREGAEL
jgi:prepilin-type N-terminal cleavage/methylation domain-containing protein